MISFHYHLADFMADIALRGLSAETHRALRAAAKRNHRSLNGEILARLETSVRPGVGDIDALLTRIRDRGERASIGPLDDAALRELKRTGRR
jgi:plasmid stability protein